MEPILPLCYLEQVFEERGENTDTIRFMMDMQTAIECEGKAVELLEDRSD